MKNRYTFIFTLALVVAVQAQDLAKKIPSNANVVVTIKGRNVMELLSLNEFSSSRLGQQIAKEIDRETKGKMTTIEDLGLNVNENFYYFLETKEGVFYNTFMIPFSDTGNILKLFPGERDKIVQDGTVSYVQDSYDGIVAMWNKTTMLMVIPSDQNEDYNDYGYFDYNDYSVPPVSDEVAVEVVEEAVEQVSESAIDTVETIEEEGEVAAEFVYDETTEAIEEVIVETPETTYDYYQSDAYKKAEAEREKRRFERQAKREAAKQALSVTTLAYAKQLLNGRPAKSILQNNGYKKSMGKGDDEATVWVNDVAQIYKSALPKRLLGPTNPYEFLNLDELYGGMTITGRLNFEEDRAIMGLDYTMNDKMAKAYKPMYEGKFNKNFLGYINEDRLLGYMSVNLSTKGILEAYPELVESMFNSKASGTNDKAATIAAASSSVTRLFSLLIDEEGAAKILRGDMLLLLTDLREKEVTYTDYEYDEDYNYKEVEKTKTETVPDFMFLFTSEEEKLFRNFMKIGVSEKKVDYQNGIYHISKTRSTPFDIYAMYKDNTVFFGSSVDDLTQIKNDTYRSKLSGQLKKDISKSATSFYVNGKNIVSKIPSEAFPRELRNNIDFLTENTEDLRVSFSKIKGNAMTGEVVLKTPAQGHKNSLAYFMNLIDKLME